MGLIRLDIQVLRGLAVIFVLLFHMFPSLFPGGYLGVDIFFVLSGYLMAKLYPLGSVGIKSALQFYRRRLARLLPAYLVVVFVTVLAFSAIVLPHERLEIIFQAIYSLAVLPNVYFWFGESYFSDIAFRPLLHLWSLGVEMQFYILVPCIVYFASKWKGAPIFIFAISFILCWALIELSAKTAFFMMPARIWEFMAGYIVASYVIAPHSTKKLLCLQLLCWIFLLTIPFTAVDVAGHPGWYALATCMATALILIKDNSSFMSRKPHYEALGVVGDYSYSIYLVHYPVLYFIQYRAFDTQPYISGGVYSLVAFLIVTWLLSYISRNFVELSRLRHFSLNHLASLMLVGLLFGAGLFYSHERVYGGMYSNVITNISYSVLDRAQWRCGKFAKLVRYFNQDEIACKVDNDNDNDNDGGSSSILLVGDSHADAIKTVLSDVASSYDASLYLMVESCNLGSGDCSVSSVLSYVKNKSVGKLILHDLYYNMNADAIAALLSSKPSNVEVYYISPVPIWDSSVPKYLLENERGKLDSEFVKTIEDYTNFYKEFTSVLERLENQGLRVIPIGDVFCTPICQLLSDDSKPLYFDNHHLTLTGAAMLDRKFHKEIFGPSEIK
ncbi:acyltransferase family protein [Simiduia aestuariiviva]|uniref:Peptidoglycan/LPS O-acetylase OafA/YrhL n=1 Tax=Simiduia aestuariiviva TaxID=1510459 RepID=A0A839UXN3_9GAMM|nr:acyltransferase family protein [Simiduia aestuariiviva]MBB3170085.1 peptidoglycan/LPS O-acetylase OafA/YrhL [Simiduia aestuariiviva]